MGVLVEFAACTKVASRIAEPDLQSHSLQTLLQRHLKVSLNKSEQVSDWTALQLTPTQIDYAASDVAYLLPLYRHMLEHLGQRNCLVLAEASFQYLPTLVELRMLGCKDPFAY